MEKLRGVSLGEEARDKDAEYVVCEQRGSEYRGEKFVVSTETDEKAGRWGTWVVFHLIEVKDVTGQTVKRAAGVTPLGEAHVKPGKLRPRCDLCGRTAEIMIEAGYENSDAAEYARACLLDVNRVLVFVLGAGREGRILKYMDIGLGDQEWRPWKEKNES